MSYKETQELERLPKLIEDLEAEQAALMEAMSAPDYHTKSVEELRKDAERAKAIEDEIASSYERWEALEEKRQARRESITDDPLRRHDWPTPPLI